jgi:hypothetical protein
MDRSLQRNAAFLFGAAGAAAGVFGSSFAALFLARAAFPEAIVAALDWLVPVWLLLLFVLMLGLWPALDFLISRRPTSGTLAAAGVGMGMQALGIAAIVSGGPLDFIGWSAAAGGLLLLLGGLLARAGGGTEPLTWETLTSPRIVAIEGRLNVLVAGLQLVAVAVFAFILLRDARLGEAALTVTGAAASLWIVLGGPLGRLLAARGPERSRSGRLRRQKRP